MRGRTAGDRHRRQDRSRREEQGGKAPHLVAALAHGIGAVLGQVAVDEKCSEMPAVRELLKAFTDLAGAVFPIDAMHAQHDTAQAVLGRDADYVMTVKANMPTLYRRLKKLPWPAIPACPPWARTTAAGPPHHQGRAGAGLGRVRRRRPGRAAAPHGHRERQKTVKVVHLITSDRDADPATLAAWVRGRWEIETSSTGSAT